MNPVIKYTIFNCSDRKENLLFRYNFFRFEARIRTFEVSVGVCTIVVKVEKASCLNST